MWVERISSRLARGTVEREHYLHRKPPVSFAFGLYDGEVLVGVVTFGSPPSRHLQKSICPSNPAAVLELNRLWVDDIMPRNTESWFVARAVALLPAAVLVSYADTAYGHEGFIYRALNWRYAGKTDADRKTPRFDYLVPGKHTRSAFRDGDGRDAVKVRRKPKHRYWSLSGNRRERRDLARLVAWPSLAYPVADGDPLLS